MDERAPLALAAGFCGCAFTLVCIAFADSTIASQVFDALSTAATVVVSGFGVWVARQGLRTWKRQLHGAALFDACRKLLAATYELRDAIAEIRYFLQLVQQEKDEDLETARRRASMERFNMAARKWMACEIERTSVEVLYGPEAVEPFKQLRTLVGRLRWAVSVETRLGTLHRTLQDQAEGILWETDEPQSLAFTDQLADVIRRIESKLAPVVRERLV